MTAKHYEKLMDYVAMMVLAFVLGFIAGKSQEFTCTYSPTTQGVNHESHQNH